MCACALVYGSIARRQSRQRTRAHRVRSMLLHDQVCYSNIRIYTYLTTDSSNIQPILNRQCRQRILVLHTSITTLNVCTVGCVHAWANTNWHMSRSTIHHSQDIRLHPCQWRSRARPNQAHYRCTPTNRTVQSQQVGCSHSITSPLDSMFDCRMETGLFVSIYKMEYCTYRSYECRYLAHDQSQPLDQPQALDQSQPCRDYTRPIMSIESQALGSTR